MLNSIVDHQDVKSARKSLIIASASSLLLPAANIDASSIEIFGLTASLDPDIFRAILRIIVIYLSIVFFLLAGSKISKSYSQNYGEKADLKIDSIRNDAYRADSDPNYDRDDCPSREQYWDDVADYEKKTRARVALFHKSSSLFEKISLTVIELSLPLGLSFLAICYPLILADAFS